MPKLLVIVPALNEVGSVADVVHSIHRALPGTPVLVIDDHSQDGTAKAAAGAGAQVVRLPAHAGLGACLRTAYRIALECGYEYVIRVDGDGQHEAADIPFVLRSLECTGADAVIGSRFITPGSWRSTFARGAGIILFRRMLAPVLGKVVHDPTSGFVGVNRRAMELFSRALPPVCPEIGGLIKLRRHRLKFLEVPCRMHPRRTGQSSLNFVESFRYTFHALRGIVIEHTGGQGFDGE